MLAPCRLGRTGRSAQHADRKTNEMDLTGKLLIAMPGIGDPRFEHSVVFLCSHSEEGAMGLIVNKTAPEVKLGSLLEQLEIKADPEAAALPVRFGGPVETQRGFVLHSDEYESRVNSLEIPGGFAMTATLDILEDIAEGRGPDKLTVMLGYAGWGPGQLEGEIVANGWLTAEASAELLFDMADLDKWEAALRSLGVDPVSLSASAGTA
ncbi:YqgE/AlgH family protein [Phaeobacter sp. QD34_3]|uniref:YqgE/AlgH family protein n=1 Tax=unclassified Phaeobacter TaxID=2621772 RepID=UPI00237F8EF7|nr:MULTISPECIES: YqgE/AlgH family protein [unclassified Phaeobacter]MDE4134261.1 YqgE/AlgH family protein [Phaeobacter sp. QD34_3]MDE4138003.1 YqgE/AlgH family protein [Phaeobacter sp. QD34_24]